MHHTRIVLIGLSGSGKTTVGPLVARALGWSYHDLDQTIERLAGRAIGDIFATDGEGAFRALERAALASALRDPFAVIATGAGVVEAAANRELIGARSFVVWLHAPVDVLVARLDQASDRPLLAADASGTLGRMLERRAAWYASGADWIVASGALTPQQAADEIVRAIGTQAHAVDGEFEVTTPGGAYAVRIAHGALDELPERLDRLGLALRAPRRVWLVSDSTVLPLYGERVRELLGPEREVRAYAFPDGEEHKTTATVGAVYDWLLEGGVERGDVVLALGGGVVGDLAGFVAATVLRGIAVVQLPTTVLAMVDSAIGGKTGVDHPAGKNMIGAFHQPRLVLGDTSLLRTLPPAERAAGWAEAIKHGVIGDPELFELLERHAGDALALREPIAGELLQRAAAFKAGVVSGDEREQGGRILLNYGHTYGHAVEAESGYTLRHGEAVAIGMTVAGMLAVDLGLWHAADLERQCRVLRSFGLPTRVPATVDALGALRRIAGDKKVRAGRVRWVLPTASGAMTVRDDVSDQIVAGLVAELHASD